MRFPFYKQLNAMDCGPTCLKMVARHHGRYYSSETLRELAGYGKAGVSMLGISETARKIGLHTSGVHMSYEQLMPVPLPAIIHWRQNHFVVLVKIRRQTVIIADPASGVLILEKEEFKNSWLMQKQDNDAKGTVLLLEPTALFHEAPGEIEGKLNWGFVTKYLAKSKGKLLQVTFALIAGMVLQGILPFLTQGMVDVGIGGQNLSFIEYMLVAQMMLTFSSTVLSFIRNRIQSRISSYVSLCVLSDFWIKLTRLPLSYFDRHHAGDTMQRLGDSKQVQSFLTTQALVTLLSLLNLIVYAIVLVLYSLPIFTIFAAGNILYFGWIRLFMGARRRINYESFGLASRENTATIQMVQGMQEIRLNNAEQFMRWEWENIQAKIFRLGFRILDLGQVQSTGAMLISQGKDILISFVVARMVMRGEISFGAMLAIQYVIGQLSGPISELVGFFQNLQDAKISMERLGEVHAMKDEEPRGNLLANHLPDSKHISIKRMSFTYPGLANDPVLRDINLTIDEGKTTAIVGMSGSGKTTLLKILLKIHGGYDGDIRIGHDNFHNTSPAFWRRHCGAVMQDGYIFNDTIAGNIAVGKKPADKSRLVHSCAVANILDFINTLPQGFDTRLGSDGLGISQGQRQRLLIARAVYKDPEFLFFDEATNSLDANNEREIVNNLKNFFEGRTVVVVAHRLSTVKEADKIVVLSNGRIAEEGTHHELVSMKGRYFELVKNQLELAED